MAVWAASRAGAFDFWTTVPLPDGRTIRLASVYGTVDHPFHATRAELLRRAIADGHPLRWIKSHQGGYPAEFYPLGVAGFEVALWTLLIGLLPMVLVHKLTVVLILLAPGAAYAIAARRDRLPLGVGLVAMAAHLVVRGWWWSGGYQELVEWGLVTNVAAAVSALFFLVFVTTYLRNGRGRDASLAVLCGGFCVYSNPRAVVALIIAGIGGTIAVGLNRQETTAVLKRIVPRLVVVTVATVLVAAPEIVSLVRFDHLYYFVRYERYADLSDYWRSSIQAVSGPVFVAGVIGIVMSLVVPRRTITRATAVTLVLYCLTTAILSANSFPADLGAHLETTRLMPFQRLLTLFVAAIAVHDVAVWLMRRRPAMRQFAAEIVLVAVAGALPLLYVVAPPSWIPAGDRGLVSVPTATTAGIADLEEAVRAADAAAAHGTALLILGSTLSWHAQLWAPLWSDRPFFYDDWLWYWQTRHVGPYNPLVEHAYDPAKMVEVLDASYLGEHGIGAVIVTETARTALAARSVPTAANFELLRSGIYDVYLVRAPTTIVTFDGVNAQAFADGDQSIKATGAGTGGEATIRRNWFPRWRAWVNGEPVVVTEAEDGYMSVPIPSGQVTLELRYAVDGWDWLARLLCAIGIVVIGLLATVRPRFVPTATPRVRLARR